ncbi:hypothetical protein [Patulibacter defluvii]|uniref:hypothetical protein n=1 Tax=Patulibacter defluvii TaxID=3095358 RepID=UPI002A750ED1|nr:hypothetical protein [Patulibacter sp. DM4]
MLRLLAPGASALTFALALAAPAGAAFSNPVELDSGVGVAGLTVDGQGGRVVVARGAGKGNTVDTRLLGVAGDGQPEGRRTIAGLLPDPLAFGRDAVLHARSTRLGSVQRSVPNGRGGTRTISLPRVRLGVSVGDAPSVALGKAANHGTAVLDEPVRIAGTTSGNVVMAWSDVGADGVVRVYASWRRATTKKGTVRLSAPKLVSGSRASRLLALATGQGGDTVLVYQRGASESTRRLYVRSLDVRSGKLGTPQTLRRGGPGFPSATASVGRGGRAVVAWGEQDGAADRTKPYVVRATTRNDDRHRFAAPKPLDRGSTTVRAPGGSLVAIVDRANRPLVAWSQVVGSVADGTAHDIPRIAEGGVEGGLGPARDIAAAGRVHGLASARSVTGLVLVREQEVPRGGSNGDRGVAVQVAVRPATGTLGTPATVEALTDAQLLDRSNAFGSAAIGALPDGRFTVAWTRATVVSGKLRTATLLSDGAP